MLGWLGALPLAGCTRARRADDDPLELLAFGEASSVDPRFVTDVYGLRIARLAFATLAAPHPDTLRPEPWLAEALDDDDDGAVIATLRADACFHDGTPIRARDVLATWRALGDPTLGSRMRRVVEQLAAVEALDGEQGLRVRFVPRVPRAILRGDLDQPVLKADEALRPRGAPLTGSGPYALVDWRAGAVALSPASSFARWGGAKARRAVVVRTVRDETARALRLLAEAADVASNVLPPPLALALPRSADAPAGLTVVQRAAPSTTFLGFHVERPPLDRAEVRRAIAQSIDRDALLAAILGGAGSVADGLIPPILDLAAAHPAPRPFDPSAAREVLAPLGAGGSRLTLVVLAQRGRVELARAIGQMIGDAGLPVDVRSFELGTLLARLDGGSFDLAIQSVGELVDPELWRWHLGSRSLPPQGLNRGRVRDPEVDALLDRGLGTLDRAARAPIYAALEARVHERCWVAPLLHEAHVAVVGRRAAGFTPSADGRWGAIARVG